MKKVLFTGARSGIAHATIKRFLDKEYLIYVTVRTDKQLELIKETYQDYKNVICLKLDITNKEDLKILETLDIDILVNNAAIGEGGSMAEIPIDKIRRNFEVNVFSTFAVIQIVLKKMMQKGEGRIINVSSLFGVMPYPFLGAYCGSKASLSKMTTLLKKELKLVNSNIQVILVEPGLYHTGFNQVMLNNKYDWMHTDSYFSKEIENIRMCENKVFNLLEKTNLNSIVKKLEKAIVSDNPCFIYRAPFSHAMLTKLYSIFMN
jgi:short-subunit dehydrogenase